MCRACGEDALASMESQVPVKTFHAQDHQPPTPPDCARVPQVTGNPCLSYVQHIVLPWCEKFEVERKEDNGGNK